MELKDLPRVYESYQSKYSLPSYDELNKEFELLYIGPLTSLDFPLRFMRRRIADRLASAVSYLQTLLQPNPSSLVYLRESSFFSVEEKQQIVVLLKEFMQLERRSFALELTGSEQDDAHYIRDAHQHWLVLKKQYAAVVKKLPERWQQQEEKKTIRNQYVG